MSTIYRILPSIVRLGQSMGEASRLALSICVAMLSVAIITMASAESRHPTRPEANKQGKQVKRGSAAPARNADGTIPDAIAKRGVETRVAIAWDCNQPDVAPAVFAHAEHGKIRITSGTGPSCGRRVMNLTIIFYTSNPGFVGTDNLSIMGLLLGGQFQKKMTILVK